MLYVCVVLHAFQPHFYIVYTLQGIFVKPVILYKKISLLVLLI